MTVTELLNRKNLLIAGGGLGLARMMFSIDSSDDEHLIKGQ